MTGNWRSICLVAIAAFGLAPQAGLAMESCTIKPSEIPVNNVAAVPQGTVDNQADEAPGQDLPAEGFVSPTGLTVDDRGVYISIQWGSEPWREPRRNCAVSRQVFDFWPAAGFEPIDDGKTYPTIVYFHPNGVNHHFETGSDIYNNVAKPAHDLGYNFISVEFRHPVVDQYLAQYYTGEQVPHKDAGLFIQFLRDKASRMKVATKYIFAFGHSRGALALWQSLAPDLGSGATSSRVAGFVGYQAQTTYRCDDFATTFLIEDDWSTYQDWCMGVNPYYSQFGSALAEVTNATKLPVMLQYAENFYLQSGSQTAIEPISAAMLISNFDEEHYPNFGMALYNTYNLVGINEFDQLMARPTPNMPTQRQFEGWQAFVSGLIK